jgi:hypothetical protein
MKAPWSDAQRGRIIARAIRFIEERAELHAFELAMEVGKHLFKGLFRSDPMLVRAGGEWKRDSFRRIASDLRVRMSEQKLSACVHAYLAVRVFKNQAPEIPLPDLSPWEWARLDVPLVNHPEAVVEIARWRQREGVSREMLRSAAQLVKPYLEAGGKLEDILPGLKGRDTPYKRIRRILGIIDGWLDEHELSEVARQRALATIDGLLAELHG